MSGTWVERAEAGQAFKAADVGNALRDLAAAVRTVQGAVLELDGRDEALGGRLDEYEAKAAGIVARLAEIEAALKPAAKATPAKVAAAAEAKQQP